MPGLFHLGWRANGDNFDVALAVNRLLASGARAWLVRCSRSDVDAGDYIVELTTAHARALADAKLDIAPFDAPLPGDAKPLTRPAVRVFAGEASKFPYFAYYALCLLRLGVDYVACDGETLANGTLDDANLLILPGGFATWGIDAAENASGADARIRRFLAEGGAAIGSCGGAYYLSSGRPAWTGTAAAKPRYTHEYLQTGVGIVTIALRDGPLALGCVPTMEVPYYHGPVYDALGEGIDVAATFDSLALSGRLAIDNPLDRAQFEREMAGKPAILIASGKRGRAVLFSPHPEMGDLVRKYIALDGYVRHYLPIRGIATMRDTLRHYRVCDAPCFRLVCNAIHVLLPDVEVTNRVSGNDHAEPTELARLCEHALGALPDFGRGDEGDLMRDIETGLRARLEAWRPRVIALNEATGALDRLQPSLRHLIDSIGARAGDRPDAPAQALIEADLAVSLLECWTRAAGMDLGLASAR
ncbi:MAG TPA: hypothetical protein VJ891_17460 [Casimicrobiaceae bacterium]|nr:hypothetical protein [Casimicrobiaceae bacterium]